MPRRWPQRFWVHGADVVVTGRHDSRAAGGSRPAGGVRASHRTPGRGGASGGAVAVGVEVRAGVSGGPEEKRGPGQPSWGELAGPWHVRGGPVTGSAASGTLGPSAIGCCRLR
jgi:hypothetical protein